jgi:hypothetical protein
MCSICDDWKSKKITSKEAFERVSDALNNSNDEKTRHLMELSAIILDKDVPMKERDEELEKKWSEENRED